MKYHLKVAITQAFLSALHNNKFVRNKITNKGSNWGTLIHLGTQKEIYRQSFFYSEDRTATSSIRSQFLPKHQGVITPKT
jgi:hypothetical protein